MIEIWTGQYRYNGSDRLDITVKGNDPRGKYFAPSWNMVMGIKNSTMTEADYRNMYMNMLMLSHFNNKPVWDAIDEMGVVTLVCYCRANTFCHRYLLKDFLCQVYPGSLYRGEH